jgi:hypothetical protein
VAFVVAFYAVLLALAAVALWRAQTPERLVIALFVAAAVLSYFSLPARHADAPTVLVRLLLIDTVVTGMLAWIAIRYGRKWCIVAAALQIISTLSHLGRMIDPTMNLDVYGIMESASSIPQVLLLAAAIWRHPRVRARSLPPS